MRNVTQNKKGTTISLIQANFFFFFTFFWYFAYYQWRCRWASSSICHIVPFGHFVDTFLNRDESSIAITNFDTAILWLIEVGDYSERLFRLSLGRCGKPNFPRFCQLEQQQQPSALSTSAAVAAFLAAAQWKTKWTAQHPNVGVAVEPSTWKKSTFPTISRLTRHVWKQVLVAPN